MIHGRQSHSTDSAFESSAQTTEKPRPQERGAANQQVRQKVDELERANSDLHNLLTSTNIATIFVDRELNITRFTPAMLKLVNLLPSDVGRPIADFAQEVFNSTLIDAAKSVLKGSEAITSEVRAQDGSWHLRRVLPYYGNQNAIEGVVITFTDITERKAAEESLRRSEERFRLIVESATDFAILTLDLDGRIATWNTGCEKIFGYGEDEIIGQSGDIIFTHEDREGGVPREEMDGAREEGRAQDDRWMLRRDGSRFWAGGYMMPLRDEGESDSRIRGYLKILQDKTPQREREHRKEILLAELNHRVKNMLSMVQAISSLTMRSSGSLEEFAAAFSQRLQALARAQKRFVVGAGSGSSIEGVVRDEIEPFLAGDTDDGHDVAIEGPAVMLSNDQAQAMGLILHEIVTNATKYGAMSKPSGRVAVRWQVEQRDASPWVDFRWVERDGPSVTPPAEQGFGSYLIESSVASDLDGEAELRFPENGFECRIRFPLHRAASRSRE